MTNKTLLRFLMDAGADEAIGDAPRNYFAAPKIEVPVETVRDVPQAHVPTSGPIVKMQASPSLAAGTARELADKAATLADLEAAVRAFEGCALKKTASKTVFSDGNPNAAIMVIGEAPGAEEDVQGIPFCGPSGKLLDKMFAAIRMDRKEHLYISNTVFWRPPGNRQPSLEETSICAPLVERHIALIRPKLIVLAGGIAAGAVLGKAESISRLRGKTFLYQNPYLTAPIPLMVTYHPSYLLRQPAQKRLAWQDMLAIQEFIKSVSA